MSESYFDFHVHSYLSDGDHSPDEVCRAAHAHETGLAHIALTDHDAILPEHERKKLAQKHDIDLISGCEISCLWTHPGTKQKVVIHLGGHWLVPHAPLLHEVLKHNQAQPYDSYVKEMLWRCEKLGLDPTGGKGVDNAYEQIKAAHPHSKHLGKRAVAQFLVSSGCVETRQAAYELFACGGPAHVVATDHLQFVPFEEAMCAINRHGITTLNHLFYYHLDNAGYVTLLQDFKRLGGQALEAIYPRYGHIQRMQLYYICKDYDLIPNAGSDRHDDTRAFMQGPDNLYQQLRQRQLEMHGTLRNEL